MTELKRWLDDDAPPEVGRLLRAARAEAPRRRSIQRTLVALGATGLATTAGAKTVAGAVAITLKWVAVGAVGGSVVVGTVAAARHFSVPAAPPAASARWISEPAPKPAEPGRQVEPPAAPETSPAPKAKSSVPVASREPEPAPGVDRRLAEEIGMIDRARASLNAGNPAETLRALDDYDRTFSEPRLGPEALYLRMEARARVGDRAGAERAAREIVERYPGGPQVGRAEELLRSDPTLKKP